MVFAISLTVVLEMLEDLTDFPKQAISDLSPEDSEVDQLRELSVDRNSNHNKMHGV